MSNLDPAYKIATKSLKNCYTEHGIIAGVTHFNDYWARDSFFASLGALQLGHTDIVRKNLELFISQQAESGQIPLRIGNKNTLPKLLGIKMPRQYYPVYKLERLIPWLSFPPADVNSLFIVIFSEYVKQTGDTQFLKKHLKNLDLAYQWIEKQTENDLLKEGYTSGWADSINKTGFSLYSNCCYYKATLEMSWLYSREDKQKKLKFAEKADQLRATINKSFWTHNYYLDWFNEKAKHNNFAVDGNMLAIIWGIADQQKSRHILEFYQHSDLNKAVPSRTNTPAYPANTVFPLLRLVGMSDYHNHSLSWLWLGCITAQAQYKFSKKAALETLTKVAETISKYGDVYEVYDREGKPLARTLYHSEKSFSWSAGMFIQTVNLFKKNIHK